MSKMLPVKHAAIAAGLLALAALGGCHKEEPEQPVTNTVIETNVTDVTNEAAPAAKVTPSVTTNAVDSEVREAPPTPDVQTQDDADATGMTSHVQRDTETTNEATP